MKKMTVEEWGNAIFSKVFKVLYVNYDDGATIVFDTQTDTTYSVTFDDKKQKLILEKLDDE